MLKDDVSADWKGKIENLIADVKYFLTCAAFQEAYMDHIKVEMPPLYSCIVKEKESVLNAFDSMEKIVTKEMSMNTLLRDDHIRQVMVETYGYVPIIEEMGVMEKVFFFENGDSSQFGLSLYDNGTK